MRIAALGKGPLRIWHKSWTGVLFAMLHVRAIEPDVRTFVRRKPMKRIVPIVCCGLLCFLAVPAQTRKTAPAAAPMTDQQFVDFAAQTDMVEANLGKLAESAASSQQVKDYGHMLASDHTKDFHELNFVAQKVNLKVPDAIDAGHTKAIAIYTREAGEQRNPALKDYAESALPVLQKHLDNARSLEKKGK
jgi:putative membrane protein